ncbi:DUF1109 family protein [Rhodococcus spelaei]|uniref:DUF1109 family protein n=1 Tax=Rhodococcus spelaei TaxID=2546320 RepID=A0A541AYT7_9NOCA|nr:DUF1109 family protein [Rhodococcus spelaei]
MDLVSWRPPSLHCSCSSASTTTGGRHGSAICSGVDPLLFGGVALLALAVAGLIWAIRTLYVVGQDRRWSWWILPVPLAMISVLAIGLLLPSPTFDEMRPQFEQTAHDLLASCTAQGRWSIG